VAARASRAGVLRFGLDHAHRIGGLRGFAGALLVATEMSGLHFSLSQNHSEQRECGDDGAEGDDGRDRHVRLLLSLR
jgi:hypothetical protein